MKSIITSGPLVSRCLNVIACRELLFLDLKAKTETKSLSTPDVHVDAHEDARGRE